VAAPSAASVVGILGQVIWAYFDRMAAGDWVRAGVVLTTFQATYNRYSSILTAAAEGGSIPSTLPVNGQWDNRTRDAAFVILQATLPVEMEGDLRKMPTSGAMLGVWFGTIRSRGGDRYEAVVRLIADKSVPQTAGLVQRYVDSQLGASVDPMTASAATFDVTSALTATTQRVREIADELPVVGTRARQQMPLWGFIALAAGGVVAAGVLIWGIVKKRKGARK